ncbi:MAG: hypothetical protein ACK4WC_17110 [Rubrimonas sp.]
MTDPLDPAALTGLDRDPERLREVAAAFAAIRVEIDRLRTVDLEDVHPAVVFRPLSRALR